MKAIEAATKLAVIIPTLNEEGYLACTLRHVLNASPKPDEIIIVDGGSSDNTIQIARQFPVRCIQLDKAGRGRQMNAGVKQATSNMYCFLHADTLVPGNFVSLIKSTLNDDKIACGGFISIMKGQKTRWLVSLHNYVKTWYAALLSRPLLFFFKNWRMLYGDQVMFCRADVYQQCGGFDEEAPIMEDADFCLKAVHYGKIKLVPQRVYSSDRRVARWGFLKANIIYIVMATLWAWGVPPVKLARWYTHIR
jgi:rSAM/selenodomain-associated transferase 2